ncbi:MAG: YhcN/YlaJ family sporulation lipoprotein [Thermoanaerobacteraceae bacterium]|nr:YhcN/YlaJ family sporulation lipoprotein [Thermoanaerobacteraceae bacterium]
MKKILIIISTIVLSFSLALSGCSASKKPAPKSTPPAKMTPTPAKDINPATPTPNRKPATPAHTQASKLSQAAEEVEGVKAATVVVTGTTVMIGLETEPGIEDKQTEKIKTKVTEQVKKADNSIKTVSITTDPNLITRLKKIAQGIKDGKPISSFTDELAEITRRLTPKTKTK